MFEGPEWFWVRVLATAALLVWGLRQYARSKRFVRARLRQLAEKLNGKEREGIFWLWVTADYEGRALRVRLPIPWGHAADQRVTIEFAVSRHVRGKIRPKHALEDIRSLWARNPKRGVEPTAQDAEWFSDAGLGRMVVRRGKARITYDWRWKKDPVQEPLLVLHVALLFVLLEVVDPGGPTGTATI